MVPVLFRIPGIGYDVPGYGGMLMIGFLLSIIWAAHRAAKSRANPDVVLNCGFIALFGGVVGARIMYVVHYWNEQFAPAGGTAKIIRAVLDVRQGGLEVYGGLVTVCVLVLLYLWRGRHSVRWYLDIMAPSAALGMAIGRIGCFLNGCCWGGVAPDLAWAVRFPCASPAATQQWIDRRPGAELPKELVAQHPRGLLSSAGRAADPMPRIWTLIPDATIERALQACEGMAEQQRALEDELAATTDTKERQRLAAEIDALARAQLQRAVVGAGCGQEQYQYNLVEHLQKHHLTVAQFRALAAEHRSLPVHPTQLYSTITLGLVALVLNALYWRRTRDGQVILALFLLEPPARWALEVLRADNPVDTAGLTISQFLAIAMVILSILGLLLLRRWPRRSPSAVPWEPPVAATQPAKAGAKGK